MQITCPDNICIDCFGDEEIKDSDEEEEFKKKNGKKY